MASNLIVALYIQQIGRALRTPYEQSRIFDFGFEPPRIATFSLVLSSVAGLCREPGLSATSSLLPNRRQ